jgi:transposase
VNLTTLKSPADLPRDLNVLQPMLWSLILENRKLTEDIQLLKKEVFGKKSEKQIVEDDSQMQLEGLFEQIPNVIPAQKDTVIEVKVHERRKKHPGRNVIPDDIETQKHIIDLSDEEKTCTSGCGKQLVKLREEKRIVIERQPAKYIKHVYIQYIYGCGTCKDKLTAAEAPLITPLPRIMAGINLLLFVILSKYQFHLPLYRIQRQIYHESRIWFTRSTMVGWIAEICVPLRRIYQEMINEVKTGSCIHSDDSRVKRCAHTSFMWVYVNGVQTIGIFDYRESRGASAPREFLKGVAQGTYLMTDCCPSYNDAVSKYSLVQMACMMHVRREFVEAAEVGSQKEFALKIVRFIGQIYRIERHATAKKFNVDERHALRQKYSKPVMDKIRSALLDPQITVLPQSRIGKAINYTNNHWVKIARFLDRSDLPIDNGASERIIRDLAIGRKNWMHVMSDEGGKRMAILYSIIATCKMNNINPEEYLNDVLMRIAIRAKDASVKDLIPTEWLKARNGGCLPEKQPLYPSRN